MIPSIVAFSELLTSSKPPFKSWSGVVPILEGDTPKIIRTTLFAEAQITMNGRNYALCLPLSGAVSTSVERLCSALNSLRPNALTEYRLLKGEISFLDAEGNATPCDLILHALPDGEPLDVAVTHIATQRITKALDLLEAELLKVGFLHGNLKPSNLIFGDDGRIYPIRYHYAQVGVSAEQISAEITAIRNFVETKPFIAELGEESTPCNYQSCLPYDEVAPLQDMMRRVRQGSLYGYLNDKDEEVIEPQFIYAENFFENRAVVQNPDGKMGVIDHHCQWIIPPHYDMIGFEDGIFNTRIGEEWHTIDYLGKTIE